MNYLPTALYYTHLRRRYQSATADKIAQWRDFSVANSDSPVISDYRAFKGTLDTRLHMSSIYYWHSEPFIGDSGCFNGGAVADFASLSETATKIGDIG